MKERHKQIFLIVTSIIAIIFLGYAMIKYSEDITVSVYNSINCCLTVIIPSLYGFMAISVFLIRTNIYAILSKPFSVLSRYVFKIPEELFSVFIISLFAGYPVGAKLIYELKEQNRITEKDAEEMLCYCYTSSPTFVIGLVGIQLFSSLKVGLYIYLSLVLTNILLAFIIGLRKKVPLKSSSTCTVKINSQIFISSIESGAKSLFQVCLMIVFFSILTAIFKNIGLINFLSGVLISFSSISADASDILIKSIFEISNISLLPQFCFKYLPIITGIFSFGGICIVFQISALTKGKIRLIKFIIVRIVSAFISAGIGILIFSTIGSGIALSVGNHPTLGTRNISPIPSVFLVIMTVILLSKRSSKNY